MKNLKKVLALGLALVMILGMFTIASAAETKITAQDFTDWNDVEHKDAVALAVDLGIISGIKQADGSYAYKPNDPIDRASWAKLVYFTATGDDNADAYLGTATDLTDIKGNWAESYINYIYVNEYVSGDGQGHFMPTSNITVAGGLKTMLTVLGYDAEDRGYQNDSAWMGNIMTDGKRNGLMDDIARSNTAATNLTRDVAAQIVYNALQANTQTPEYRRDNGESYVVSYTKGFPLARDVFSVAPVTATVDGVASDGTASFKAISADVSGITPTTALDGKVKASASMVGETVTVWVKVKGTLDIPAFDKDVVSTTVAKAASSATATFTDGLGGTFDNLKTKSDKDHYVADAFAADAEYILNGESNQESEAKAAAIKAGNKVEVYASDNEITMVKVTEYNVAKVSDDVETRTRNDKLQVYVPGVTDSSSNWVEADKVSGYQGLAKDDVVLYVKDSNDNYEIEKAEKVTGTVSSKRTGTTPKLTIGGKQYTASAIDGMLQSASGDDAKVDIVNWTVKNDVEYDFYLDVNGSICWATKVSGEVETEVAYVLQAKYLTSGNTTWDSSSSVQAELLFTDGTTEIVTIAKATYNDGSNDVTDEKDDLDADTATALGQQFVDYSVNKDGKYDVKIKTTTGKTGTTLESKIEFIGTGNGKADNKTVFLIQKGTGDDAEYSVYTGFGSVSKANLASVTSPANNVMIAANDKGVAEYVFALVESFAGDATDGLIYVKDNATYDVDGDGNKIYEVVDANGKEIELTVGKDVAVIDAKGFYSIDATDEDGIVTKATKKVALDNATELNSISNGVVTYDTDEAIGYDKDTVCVVITLKSDKAFDSVSTFNPDSFKMDGNNYGYTVTVDAAADAAVAEYLYVVRTEK